MIDEYIKWWRFIWFLHFYELTSFFFLSGIFFLSSSVEIVSWHYEKSNTISEMMMLTIQTFDFVVGTVLFLVVLYYFQSRFTRITTHSCYTVGCCASESQSKGLRHVRTYNGSGEKEDNEWRLHHNITSVATNILSNTVLMCSSAQLCSSRPRW